MCRPPNQQIHEDCGSDDELEATTLSTRVVVIEPMEGIMTHTGPSLAPDTIG